VALDDLGLLPSLRALARDYHESGRIEIVFVPPKETLPELASEGEAALYRAMQEALANSVRHAGASRIVVMLDAGPQSVTLTVEDDGPGFPADATSRLRSRGGLAGIRERITALGGAFSIANGDGGGAVVRVVVPSVDARTASKVSVR
jgi:two-component system sensor histidine kinase UhpB